MMLASVLLTVHILLAVTLIALILLQHGKGAEMGAGFGSGASGSVFGARGSASFLSRTTGVLATVFFVNCLALAYLASHNVERTASVMDRVQPAPVAVPPEQSTEEGITEDVSSQPAATADIPVDVPVVPDEQPRQE